MSAVADRLARIREQIAAAAREAGRRDQVALVAVSKTHPAERIREAYAAGQRDFGESYAQELQHKAEALADLPELRWHFVGHLQSNKARVVAPLAVLVHTVDSERLAQALLQRRPELGVLIEVNLAGESQKGGISPEGAPALCRALTALPGLALRGLMCIPPAGAAHRPFFAQLRELRERLARETGAPLPELSMGMSSDFADAIAEGATLVRVGTALFGPRG